MTHESAELVLLHIAFCGLPWDAKYRIVREMGLPTVSGFISRVEPLSDVAWHRAVFSLATEEGALASMWDMTMKEYPDTEGADNPFRP